MRRTYKNMKTPIKTKTVKIVTNKKIELVKDCVG